MIDESRDCFRLGGKLKPAYSAARCEYAGICPDT